MKASVVWKDHMAFNAQLENFSFMIDADPSVGGQNLGPKPKGLTLVSLAGCTAMDVISILGKMKIQPDIEFFEVATDGVLEENLPRRIQEITISYIFKGEKLPGVVEKIKHAIELSMNTYCGVSATLRPTVKLNHKLIINGQEM